MSRFFPFLFFQMSVVFYLCASSATLITVVPTTDTPVMDGEIVEEEWLQAVRSFGMISRKNQLLCGRQTTLYFSCDNENLYFAQQSDMPPEGIPFVDEHAVELLFVPPGTDTPRSFRFTPSTLSLPDGVRIAHTQQSHQWHSEMVLPIRALGLTGIPWGEPWKMQVYRYWFTPEEVGMWHPETPDTPFGTMILEKDSPALSFDQKGRGISHVFRWRCENRTLASVNFKVEAERTSIENPISYSRTDEVKPGKSQAFELRGMWASGTSRCMKMALFSDGRLFYRRTFEWDDMEAVWWTNPQKPLQFDYAVYPSYRMIKARLSCGNQDTIDTIRQVMFRIIDEKGTVLAEIPAENRGRDFFHKGTLPDLPIGEYQFNAEASFQQGENEKFPGKFSLRSFPWQNNEIGMERIIIPPFKPLTIRESSNEVMATETGFLIAGGFWQKIYALGENILAAPIELLINNQKFEPVSLRLLEAHPDRVVYESRLRHEDMQLTVLQDYDYDGFCKVSLRFQPGPKGMQVNSLYLDVPLQEKISKLFHSTSGMIRRNVSDYLPPGEGLVWDSTKPFHPKVNQGNFRPYMWIGEFYKGLSWLCESPKNWSMAPGKASLEIFRSEGRVTFRVHLVNLPVLYDAPFEIVMGFQPTPVKKQPADTCHKLTDLLYRGGGLRFDNVIAVRLNNSSWRGIKYPQAGLYPPEEDLSFWELIRFCQKKDWNEIKDEVELACRAYMQKHDFPDNNGITLRDLLRGCIHNQRADLLEAYFNPRSTSNQLPEYSMYVDEWSNPEYRIDREVDEYNNDPVRSFQDFQLYYIRKTVRNGWDFVNFDNVYDTIVYDDVTSDAEELSPGIIRPAFSILKMRELIKRTATMLYQENKMFAGRPMLTVHMTSSNIIPMLSFAAASIDWEMNYGGQDYQDRFPEGYVYAESLGTQSGTMPITLIQSVNDRPEEVARTLLATTFGYGLMRYRDGTTIIPDFMVHAVNIVRNFGYGNPGVAVYPGWHPDNPLLLSGVEAKATVLVKERESLVMLGSFGPEGILSIDLSGLQFKEPVACNAESGAMIASGQQIQIPLPRYDYRLLLIREK